MNLCFVTSPHLAPGGRGVRCAPGDAEISEEEVRRWFWCALNIREQLLRKAVESEVRSWWWSANLCFVTSIIISPLSAPGCGGVLSVILRFTDEEEEVRRFWCASNIHEQLLQMAMESEVRSFAGQRAFDSSPQSSPHLAWSLAAMVHST